MVNFLAKSLLVNVAILILEVEITKISLCLGTDKPILNITIELPNTNL